MPTSNVRILAAIIITAPLLILAVSARGHHRPKNHHWPLQPKDISMAREFLLAHNKVRLHSGEAPLQWDRALSRYARRYAKQRAADCKMVHSYGPYGENIFWGGRDHWTPTQVVRSWAREHRHYKKETNECTKGQICGHYTQIVWKQSSRIGCARIKCKNGGLFALCEYDPPGNWVNESPFGYRIPARPPPSTTSPSA
ncbi:hypothetical protein L1049_008386 [Liquidambar formosana]|uniref:SCP domain-containing protein n=1 Tax=Liquidambar formosana TaxID=63359 RepID=A0AAP0S3K2_LIQFO